MLILGSQESTSRISNPYIRRLIELRLEQLGSFDDGLLIVVEAADSVAELEVVSGCSILHDPFEDVPFGHPDFTPSFDYLETHHDESGSVICYEMHFDDSSTDGIGTTLFIRTEEGINADMLALCRTFATNAVSQS